MRQLIKEVGKLGCSSCVSYVTSKAISTLVKKPSNPILHVATIIGISAVSYVVADTVVETLDKRLTDIHDEIKSLVDEMSKEMEDSDNG